MVTTFDDRNVRKTQNRTTVPVNCNRRYACARRLGRLDVFRLILLGKGSSHLANSPLEERISVPWISECWAQKGFGRISWRILRWTWSNFGWKPPWLPDTCPFLFQLILALALQATSVTVAQYTNGRVDLPATPATSSAVRHPPEPTVGSGGCEINELTGFTYELSQQELWCGMLKVRITCLRSRQLSYHLRTKTRYSQHKTVDVEPASSRRDHQQLTPAYGTDQCC